MLAGMDKEYKLSRNELAEALEVTPQAITKAVKVGRLEGTWIENPSGQGYLFDRESAQLAFLELDEFDGITLQEVRLEQEKLKARLLQLKLQDALDARKPLDLAAFEEQFTNMPIG